jgi:nicotinate-nucleotide adenylyltransferase
MATLLYGGSFDPITIGHLLCARNAMEDGAFKEVIFIPCGDAPHKKGLIPFEHRWNMLKLAIKGEAGFDKSQIEGDWAQAGKKSYTIETYRYLRDHLAGNDVRWLIGADNVQHVRDWYDFPAIQTTMKFAVIPRDGETDVFWAADYLKGYGVTVSAINTPLIPISSTMVRTRIKQKKSVRYLVPESVDDYIKKHGLYKGE